MNKASDRDKEIKELYMQGLAMNKVADALGISVGKTYNRLKAMGVKSRSISDYEPTEKQIMTARELGKAGKGRKLSKETRAKISAGHFKGGIGHKKKRTDGYIAVYFPDHPNSNLDGYIMEHIIVAEAVAGRRLKENECVHHKNFKRDDNRASNLQIMTKSGHMSFHMKLRHRKGA